jgi:hypothetical protein
MSETSGANEVVEVDGKIVSRRWAMPDVRLFHDMLVELQEEESLGVDPSELPSRPELIEIMSVAINKVDTLKIEKAEVEARVDELTRRLDMKIAMLEAVGSEASAERFLVVRDTMVDLGLIAYGPEQP